MIRLDYPGSRTSCAGQDSSSSCSLLAATSAVVPVSAQSLAFDAARTLPRIATASSTASPACRSPSSRAAHIVWEAGLGKQDVEANINASADTPYYIGNLSQIFGSTLLLREVLGSGHVGAGRPRSLAGRPSYPRSPATVRQLLSHQRPSGAYAHDPSRFGGLTGVVEECADLSYRHVLAREVFDRLAMTRSVPGPAARRHRAARARDVLFGGARPLRQHPRQMARSYRLDRGRPVRSTLPPVGADAATGAITTVLAICRASTRRCATTCCSRATSLTTAWTQTMGPGGPLPTGLGWFVQNYNGEPLVWQFDLTRDAASSMIVKLPARDITFIMLANSDGLAAPFGLARRRRHRLAVRRAVPALLRHLM